MTKSLANKIQLKERLYTFSMAEGTPIQKPLDAFNSTIIDLKSSEVKIEDEDKAILLVVSLPPPIHTSKKSYYIVTMIPYILMMLRITYYSKKSLILKCVQMTKLKVYQYKKDPLKMIAQVGAILRQSRRDVHAANFANTVGNQGI